MAETPTEQELIEGAGDACMNWPPSRGPMPSELADYPKHEWPQHTLHVSDIRREANKKGLGGGDRGWCMYSVETVASLTPLDVYVGIGS